MKPLNLPKESQEALLNGASIFLVPIVYSELILKNSKVYKPNWTGNDYGEIEIKSPYQIGDKVYLQEYVEMSREGYYESEEIKPSQCGYKIIIKDIKIIRVQDLDVNDVINLRIECNGENWKIFYDDIEKWYNKQYKNYDENPYIFLYEVERIK